MRVGAGVVLIAVALISACGSQVPPTTYYRAQTALGLSASPLGGGVPGSASAANSGPAPSTGTTAASNAAVSGARSTRASGSVTARSSTAPPHSSSDSSAPSHTAHSSSAATSSSASKPSSAAGCTPPTAKTPTVVVCPNAGLHEGQTVKVYASGFPGGQFVVVIECADKGDATGQGDCAPLHSTQISSSGTLSGYEIQVTKNPGRDTCSSTQRCLISVTQAALSPKYEADQHISFA